jgi:hypothetical protein
VGQGATGRSWHSASLHCQALLFPARHKHKRCASFCMDRVYNILLDDKLIGTTKFEHGDAPMGVVFGQINFIDILKPYDFIKSYCKTHKIDFDDDPGDKLISTRTIPNLKVTNDRGQEIKGLGNQISGMDSESFELTIEQIPYPFYGDEFPDHVKDYENRLGWRKTTHNKNV